MQPLTMLHLADALSVHPAANRIIQGHLLIARAAAAADAMNRHNARFSRPDGAALPVYDWSDCIESECHKAKAEYARLNPGKFASAPVWQSKWVTPDQARDGLNAWEAAVIVLTDMAREAERGAVLLGEVA